MQKALRIDKKAPQLVDCEAIQVWTQKSPDSFETGLSSSGGQTQNRTGDTRIFSPLLYRLSYLASLEKGGIK